MSLDLVFIQVELMQLLHRDLRRAKLKLPVFKTHLYMYLLEELWILS